MIEYIDHDEFGRIRLSRRRGARSIRIGLSQAGEIRLSLPYGVSLNSGLKFLSDKRNWIIKHSKQPPNINSGSIIGKDYTLRIVPTYKQNASTVYSDSQVTVFMPEDAAYEQVQEKISKTISKVLLLQAKKHLPGRVNTIAQKYGFTYRSLDFKKLKSRWGSCSSNNDLIFNIFLMQLPWNLIDYVIVHELVHTVHHHHKQAFWQAVETILPNYVQLKKHIKKFPTEAFDVRNIDEYMQ